MSRRLRIVHLVYRFSTGGLENGIVNLINGLPDEEFEHAVLCLTDWDEEFVRRLKKPVRLHALGKTPGPDWPWFPAAWRFYRSWRPDVVHSRNLATLEYQIPAMLAGVPLRVHGEHGWDMQDIAGSNLRYLRWKRLLRPFVHQYIALSAESRDYLIGKVGVPPQRCHQIINGVDTERFSPQVPKPDLSSVPVLQGAERVVGTVGRLEAVKNQALLIEAFARACRRAGQAAKGWRLILVGDGSERPALARLIGQLGMDDRVWMAGNRQDVPQLMRAMDLFVLPSLAEGISNTLLEAQASGVPVLATRVGGNPELIEEGRSGLLVPVDRDAMADAVLELLNDQRRLSAMAAAAREHVMQNFSLSRMLSRYARLYQGRSTKEGVPLCAASQE